MGALVSVEHFARVMEYIEIGKAEGATVVSGGHAVTEGSLTRGCLSSQPYSEMLRRRCALPGKRFSARYWYCAARACTQLGIPFDLMP